MSYYTSNTKAPVDKGKGVWSRMKDFGGVQMSMSALSVSGSSADVDGETETSTVIHQSLVKYYATKTGVVPDWLEPEGGEHTDLSQYQNTNSTQHQNQNYPYGQGQQQGQGGYSKRPSVSTPSSSLQDIYARRGSSAEVNRGPQQQQQQQPQQGQYNYPQQQQYGQQQYGQSSYGQTAYGRPAQGNGGNAGNGNPGNDRMREKLRQLGRSQSQAR